MAAQDRETRARQLHERGVQATNSGRPAVGSARLRRGLALLGWRGPDSTAPDSPALAGRLLLSLAWAESEQGRAALGFSLIESARTLVSAEDQGVLVQQRGLMLLRAGRTDEALAHLDAAVELLRGEHHALVLARTLMNRATFHLAAGRVGKGREDLAASATVAQGAGLGMLSAKVLHNMALADLLLGDFPSALSTLAQAEQLYREHAEAYVPVVRAARARVLLYAGLADESAATLDGGAIEALRQQRLTQDQGEAELMRARAALSTTDFPAAASWASQAARTFRRRGNDRWSAVAALVDLQARFAVRSGPRLATRAAELSARELAALDLPGDAEMAALLAARSMIASRRLDAAADLLAPRAHGKSFGWLETLVLRRLAQAELALAQQQPGEALPPGRARRPTGAAGPAGQPRPAGRYRRVGAGAGRARALHRAGQR